LSSVRLLSTVDEVTVGVTSDVVTTGCVRTSLVDPVNFDLLTCDPVSVALVDRSAFSLSMLAASFLTVCKIRTNALDLTDKRSANSYIVTLTRFPL